MERGKRRPLSDIRELTEPSLNDQTRQRLIRVPMQYHNKTSSTATAPSQLDRHTSASSANTMLHHRAEHQLRFTQSKPSTSSSYSVPSDDGPPCVIPPHCVPQRSSSRNKHNKYRDQDTRKLAQQQAYLHTLIDGRSKVPELPKQQSSWRTISSNQPHRISSDREIATRRTTAANEHESLRKSVLSSPLLPAPGVQLRLYTYSSWHETGGKLRGLVDVQQTTKHLTFCLQSLQISLLGTELTSRAKVQPFLFIVTNLTAEATSILTKNKSFGSKKLTFIRFTLPFVIHITDDDSPPSFLSAHAQVRYLLSATLVLRYDSRNLTVRNTIDAHVVAAASLARLHDSSTTRSLGITAESPTASRRHGVLRATLSMPRDQWLGGFHIPLSIRIANQSSEEVTRITLALRRTITHHRLPHREALGTDIETEQWPQRSARVSLHSHQSRMYRFVVLAPLLESTVLTAKSFKAEYAVEVEIRTSQGTSLHLDLPVHLLSVPDCTLASSTTFRGVCNGRTGQSFSEGAKGENTYKTRQITTDGRDPSGIQSRHDDRIRPSQIPTKDVPTDPGRSVSLTPLSRLLGRAKTMKRMPSRRFHGKATVAISAPLPQAAVADLSVAGHERPLQTATSHSPVITSTDASQCAASHRANQMRCLIVDPASIGLSRKRSSLTERSNQHPENERPWNSADASQPSDQKRFMFPPIRNQGSWDCLRQRTIAFCKAVGKSESSATKDATNWI